MSDYTIDPTNSLAPAISAAECGAEVLPAGFSRRSLLKGGGAASLAMLLASPLFATAANAQTPNKSETPNRPKHPNHKPTKRKRRPKPRQALGADGSYQYVTPYSAQASCTLSQDFFATTQVGPLGDADLVLPFTGTQGHVEALVLTKADGTLSHLRRDATQTSGWSYAPVGAVNDPDNNLSGPVTKATAVTAGDGSTYLACAQESLEGPCVAIYQLNGVDTWGFMGAIAFGSDDDDYSFSDDVPLRSGVALHGMAYFYMADTNKDIHIWAVGSGQTSEYGPITALEGKDLGTGDLQLLWDDTYSSGTPFGFAIVTQSDGTLVSYTQTGPYDFAETPTVLHQDCEETPGKVVGVPFASWASDPTSNVPTVVFQLDSGNVFYMDDSQGNATFMVGGYAGGADLGHVAVWRQDDLFSFLLLNDSGLATTMSQYNDTATSTAWGGAVPLQTGLHGIYCQPADHEQATVFAVDAALCLNVLEKDSTGTWSLTPIHRDTTNDSTTVVSEVDSWRVLINLSDATGATLPGQAQITADNTIGLWQSTGNTIVPAGSAVTLAADSGGRISFNVPATELDSTILHIQPLDGSGNATGDQLDVSPHTDVSKYFAGTVVLNKLGAMSGATLLGAQDANQKPIFPTVANSSDPASTANAYSDAITSVGAIGLGYQPGNGSTASGSTDFASFTADFTSGQAQVKSSRKAGTHTLDIAALEAKRRKALTKLGKTKQIELGGVSDWWNSVKHDADSVFHALRHGVIQIKTLVANFDKDLKQWVVNLAVDIGDAFDHAMDFVINDVKTAVHAISNFFHTLGADIVTALNWLKHNVLELLSKVDKNAQTIQTMIGTTAPEKLRDLIENRVEKPVDGWFASKEADVHRLFTQLEIAFTGTALGSDAPPPSNDSDSGSNTAETVLKDVGEVTKILSYVDGQWLWEKLMSHMPDSTTDNIPINTDVDAVITDIITVMEDVGDAIVGIGQTIYDAVEAASASTTKMRDADLGQRFQDLDGVVHHGLDAADKIVGCVLDLLKVAIDCFETLCQQEIDIPVLSEILKLAGVSTSKLEFGYIMGLIAAFPATLVTEILGYPLFPDTTTDAVGSHVDDPWGCALNWASFPIQFVWTLVDGYENAKLGDDARSVPDWFFFVDVIAPLMITALQWPAKPVDGKTPGFLGDPDWDGPDGTMIPFFLACGIAPALTHAALAMGGTKLTGAAGTYFETTVQTLSGIAGIVLTSLWNWENNESGYAKTIGIAGSLSYVDAPLALDEVAEATDGFSYPAKMIIDGLSGLITTCMFTLSAANA